jgi:alpha-1,6-mannosyltransferase
LRWGWAWRLGLGVATLALYAGNAWLCRALARESLAAPWGMAGYVLLTLALFALYAQILALCRRGEFESRGARTWSLAIPCIVSALLIFTVPVLSKDVFSYMAHGALGMTPGDNPLLQPAEAAAHTSLGSGLALYGWHGKVGVTPYGIVWTRIEIAAMKMSGGRITAALILFKALIAAMSTGTAFLIWRFLGHARPSAQLLGTLAYLWNPLILTEFAGEGHNDAVMIFGVLAALACIARPTASLVAQGFAVAAKYVPVLFVPAHLVLLWRRRSSGRDFTCHLIAAAAVVGLAVTVLYGPLWAGRHSFDGLLERGEPISSASPFGGINWMLRRSAWAPFAAPLTQLLVTLPLLGFIGWISIRVREVTDLAHAFAWIAVGYALFASPDYWPWYSCMPVALLIVADTQRFLWLVMLMSVTARLCAPLELLRAHDYLSMVAAKGIMTGLCTTLPLALLLLWIGWQRHRHE